MTDPNLDELAESARNRGLKLVRSRVRTPGKRRFGKVGLADASGKPVCGMDAKGPTAKPEDVEEYLRNLGASDWGASLDVPVGKRKPLTKRARERSYATQTPAANRATLEAEPKPEPTPPKLTIRTAKPGDAVSVASLIGLLEHDVDEPGVRQRIVVLSRDKLAPLVATLDKKVVGLCGIGEMVAIHRACPVGRINILVVAETAREQGIGRKLVVAAEDALRARGCELVEITSNDRLAAAHAFYRHMGYERTSIRFAKML